MVGVAMWFVADVVWLFREYIFTGNYIFDTISDNLYLIPDYMYLIGIVMYAKYRFYRRDFQMILAHVFILSVMVFIILSKILDLFTVQSIRFDADVIDSWMYFYATLFTMVAMIITYFKTGIKKHSFSFYGISVFLAIFNILECRYTVMIFMEREAESDIMDVIYLLCMMAYGIMFSIPSLGSFEVSTGESSMTGSGAINKRRKMMYRIFSIILITISIGLYVVNFFSTANMSYAVTAVFAYIVICKTIQENVLTDELLSRQKDETARLEQMVADKTRELSEMNDYLQKISNTDALTGLYNRRYGLEYFARLIKEPEHYPIALYSLDLNYFKPINDNYGHDMGDVVLREVGRRLARLGQERCTAIRIGGDEFLVIFRNASNDAAVNNMGALICERMDEPIEAVAVDEEKGRREHTFQISASIGVACFPSDTNDMETLFKMADDALYAIKHTHEKSAFLLYRNIQEVNTK
jgi:diguanylate cyclase (GGDEF)-like protein